MWKIRRRLKTYAAATLLGLAIAAAIGWLLLPALIEDRVLKELQAAGVAVISLNVASAGLGEARIEDVRLGEEGQFSAGEVIASYDLAEILGSPLERVAIRDLLIQGRLNSDGLLFGRLGPGSGSGGPLLPPSLVQALPPVEIESGRIDLATPFGPAVLPIRGLLQPKADGSLGATFDVQVESAQGAMDGALALTVRETRVDADLTIKSGSITTGVDVPIAFGGGTKLGWEQGGRPQISATLALPAARVANADFPGATLAIEMTDAQWRGKATMAQDGGVSQLEATLTVADPYGKPQLSAAGTAMATPGAWIWPVLGLPQPREGSAQLEFLLEGPLPDGALMNRPLRTPSEIIGALADGNVSGSVKSAASGLVIPGVVAIESAQGQAGINAADGALSIAETSTLQGIATAAPEFLRRLELPAALEAALMGRSTSNVALAQPLRLTAREGATDAAGKLQFDLRSAAGATLDVQANGTAVVADDLTVSSFAIDDGIALLDGLALPEGKARAEITGGLAGTPERFEGRLQAATTLSDLAIAGYQAASVDLNIVPSIGWADGRLTLKLLEDGVATARQVAGGVLAGKLEEVTLPLLRGEAPLLAIDLGKPDAPAVAFDLRLGDVKATAPLQLGGSKPSRVALALPESKWAGTWTPAGGPAATIHLEGASLSAPSLGVAAGGVRADVAISGGKAAADLAASITSSAKPALHVPLNLTGKAEADGDKLTFAGALADRRKHLRATIALEHAVATNEGQATLKMAPLTFDPAGLQPQDLVPAIGTEVEEVTGESAIAGTVRWRQGKLASDLELLLKDFSFQTPQANIIKLNSVVKIDSLSPFTTKRGQQLAAGLVDVGLPLNDLVADFHIEQGFRLVVESARLELAGGEVSLPAVAFALPDPQAELTLNVTDVDLGKLLQLAQVEGLAGTGTLAGRIPVSIAGQSIAIHNATLAANGPGMLQYVPTQSATALLGSSSSVDMALQALSNFQYNELTLTLDREPGGDTVALLHVKGQNPNFYDGYPVELNLNISGKLDQILDRGLQGYRIPETIRERLGDFGK
ncbi:MAG TPA: YdbH domain-containing protein [Dongiaceae bacterium]